MAEKKDKEVKKAKDLVEEKLKNKKPSSAKKLLNPISRRSFSRALTSQRNTPASSWALPSGRRFSFQ